MAIKKKPTPEEDDPPSPTAAAPPETPPLDVSEKNFIAELVPDPAAPPALAFLSGYPGESPLPDHVRLYTSPDLQTHVDVPREAIVAKASAPHPLCPPGADALWIKQDAQVIPNQQSVTPQAMNTLYPPTQHPTLGFTCTLIQCPTQNQQAALPRTLETICTQIGCDPAAQGEAAAAPQAAATPVGPTGWYTCGQPQHLLSAPPNCPLPPPHISLPGCERITTAPTTVVGQTGWYTCGHPHISLPGCVRITTAEPQAAAAPQAAGTPVGPTGWYTCGQPQHLLSAPPNCPLPPQFVSLPGCVLTATTTVQTTADQGAAATPQAAGTPVGPTGWYTCGQPQHLLSAPPNCPLPPPFVSLPGCVLTATTTVQTTADQGAAAAPQAANTVFGPTGWFTCGQLLSAPPNCPLPPPHISLPGCVHTTTAAPQAANTIVGPTGWFTCGQPQPILSAPPNCPLPPHFVSLPGCVLTATTTVQPTTAAAAPQAANTIVGPTGWYTCGQPQPLLSAPPHCPLPPVFVSLPGCVHTGTTVAAAAPQAAGGADALSGPTGWYTCGQPQPLLSAPPHCPLPPPHISLPGCVLTATTTVQPTTADQGGAAAAPQAAGTPVGPTGWYTCGQPLLSAPPHCPLPPPFVSLPGCVLTATTTVPPVTANQGGAAAAPQAAAPTTLVGPTGWLTCGQGLVSAPPNCPIYPTIRTTAPVFCPVSQPPHCPTVAPLCPVATVTIRTLPPGACPTVLPHCPPTNLPTLRVDCLPTPLPTRLCPPPVTFTGPAV